MNQNDEGAKIFVGGIGETGDEELRAYFAQYGTVKAVQVKYDPNTQRARGFGFIIFEDMSSVDQMTWAIQRTAANHARSVGVSRVCTGSRRETTGRNTSIRLGISDLSQCVRI